MSVMATAGRNEQGSPVVVVGESLNCLGIVRSLAGAGIEIHVVATTRWCSPALSRFAQFTQLPDLGGRVLVDGLKALSQRLGRRAVLMLGGDRQVETVNDHRGELEPLFRFTLPAAEQLRILANKASFQRFAETHGLPVPRTAIVRAAADLAALAELTLPLVLKPADKLQVLSGRADRAVRVDTSEERDAVAARMLAGSGCVVAQEWIVGCDSDIYFALFVCDRASSVVAMFCGRKLVCDPPEVGSTGICVDAGAHAGELARLAQRFIEVTGYQGIGSVEFKRDRRSGRFVIVEPTIGRTDWQEEIATVCGVNLPLQAYLSECGLPAAANAPSGRARAWSASLFYPRPRDTLPEGVAIQDGYLRLADPMPGLHHYLVEELARRSIRRIGRLLRLPHAPTADHPVARNSRP